MLKFQYFKKNTKKSAKAGSTGVIIMYARIEVKRGKIIKSMQHKTYSYTLLVQTTLGMDQYIPSCFILRRKICSKTERNQFVAKQTNIKSELVKKKW